MKPRIKWKSWFVPKGYKAWVIAPWMFFRENRFNTEDWLFRHEMEHIYQVEREGWLRFYIKYLWYSMRHGYQNNPYEIQARQAQEQPLTTAERFWKEHG